MKVVMVNVFGIFIKGDVPYVANHDNHRIQSQTSEGEFLYKHGQQGSGQGEFNFHTAVIKQPTDCFRL